MAEIIDNTGVLVPRDSGKVDMNSFPPGHGPTGVDLTKVREHLAVVLNKLAEIDTSGRHGGCVHCQKAVIDARLTLHKLITAL